ncbi:MAG TPA: hypothetical protein VJR70_05160 [Stellaceae bacterium]|nr:hypothetical protein [Stellaceae bacterium]
MRWMLPFATAAIAVTLWLPGQAAQPTAGGDGKITFEQYRDWRNDFVERRRSELAVQLTAGDLAAARKARLEQVKAYYDWLAGLSDADRDRHYRERFDRIDTDHDGTMDQGERAAWRKARSAFYRTPRAAAQPAASAAQP